MSWTIRGDNDRSHLGLRRAPRRKQSPLEPLKTFEITIPPLRPRGLSISLSIEALNWMDALQLASNELHDELGLDPDMTGLPRKEAIAIRDVSNGRSYLVYALPAPEDSDAVTLREVESVIVDEVALRPAASHTKATGTVSPAAAEQGSSADATVSERSHPANGTGDDEHLPTLPPKRRPRPKLDTAPDNAAENPSDGSADVQPRTETPVDGELSSDESSGAVTLLGSIDSLSQPRAEVQHPGIRKVADSNRRPAQRTQVQQRSSRGRTLDNATILEHQRLPAPLRKARGPVVVRNNSLRKVRTIMGRTKPSSTERPSGSASAPKDPATSYRPVAHLGQAGSTLIELIDGAVNMAFDHVPCEAVQCLMYLEDRSEMYVAAARGTLAPHITDAFVTLPLELGIERLDQQTPSNFAKNPFELSYLKSGDTHILTIETALWVPIVVEGEVIGIMMVGNSKHRKGFSPGELRGAEYLTETLSKEVQHFLEEAEAS